jgi:NAD(P)-dependent dehydrogenase (short-subunit alcohol dehydrogenase family)
MRGHLLKVFFFCLLRCAETFVRVPESDKSGSERMEGKVVLVTGANGGLGTFVTRAFLEAGATVIGTSLKIQQNAFAEANFTAIAADVSNGEGAKRLADEIVKRFGQLDVLAHTVGGFAGGQSVAETDDATFQRMLDMNLNATFHMLRAAIPALVRTKDGRIIAIGSRQAVEPGANVGAYSASKAAMVSLIQTVALENKKTGLKANVILPGTMDTAANRQAMPKADFSKWVQPASVASLMVWLAGEGGRDVNGAVIPVYEPEG